MMGSSLLLCGLIDGRCRKARVVITTSRPRVYVSSSALMDDGGGDYSLQWTIL
jgi:hypothetical protein